ncbi:type II secretion system protein [Patescibacteria group bacterium]|nr:type II secretion system protein [Patescibacteria group bacterium]
MKVIRSLKEIYQIIGNRKKVPGFSLVEIIVSVSIFSIIILSMTGIFKMVIDGQRGAIATQNVQESLKYFLEVINKEIRMAIRSDGDCGVPLGDIFKLVQNSDGDILYFKNFYGECVSYSSEIDPLNGSKRFKISRDTNFGYISPKQINIDELNFVLASDPNLQDLITINIKAKALNAPNTESAMTLQTSLSSRYYKED